MIWVLLTIAIFLVALLSQFRARTPATSWVNGSVQDIDKDLLLETLDAALDTSSTWSASVDKDGIRIATGFLPYCPSRCYRSDVEVDASVSDVATFIADEMVERLPDWNVEFDTGEVLETLDSGPNEKAWLMRVRYSTPPPIKDREYLYYLLRQDRADGSVIIAYQSVEDSRYPLAKGAARSVLYPTVHRLVPITPQRTKMEHILANDLRGRFSTWTQNNLLKGSLIAANMRDSVNQKQLFTAASEDRAST